MDIQTRLRELAEKCQTLAAKGVRSTEEQAEFEAALAEARDLKAQRETNRQFAEFEELTSRSAGAPGFANPGVAHVDALEDAGATVISSRQVGSKTNLVLEDEWGAGTLDPKKAAAVRSAEYKKALETYIRSGNGRIMDQGAYRTLQEGADTSGGFLVTPEFLDKVIAKEPTPTRVQGRVTRLTTDKDTLIMPKINYTSDDLYTSGMRVTWTGEIPSSSTASRVTEPVFGRATIPVYTAMMSIPLTNDLIEDSGFNVMDYVAGKFSETIELLYDNMILNGTGQGQPSGILMNPGDTNQTQPAVVTGGNPLTADGLIKVAYSLPEQYDMNAAWVMNKTNTAQAIAVLKDSNNRYLWGYGLQDSGMSPDIHNRTIAGYPVLFSGFMPNTGGNAFPAIFGDLSGYFLAQRLGFTVQVLRELYAETNTIVVVGRLRFGGQVVEPWKIKAVKQA